MKPVSGKVSAAAVAATMTSLVSGIVAPHVFRNGTPSDVIGLAQAGITAMVTFGAGYLARHGIDAESLATDSVKVAADLGVPYSAIAEADEVIGVPAPAPVAPAAPVHAVPSFAPVTQAVAQPLNPVSGDPAV